MIRASGLWIAIVLGIAIGYLANKTPAPTPETAGAVEFSAVRALSDVRILGATPHPVGSEANDKVRQYLVDRMTALGLAPRLQNGSSFEVYGARLNGASVTNVIGMLKGKDASVPALALMAHYDSVPGSPGAADDAAGVASALEVIRAIQAKGVPDRDVAVVLTDGEEAGLLGARIFFDEDPLASHLGYVINLETRGGGGRAAMFETAAMNGEDIALFSRTAGMPDGNALTVFVYEHLPNDTDFTIAKQFGKAGLNYAFIGSQFDYHSPSSTPATLDRGSLQHMGTEVLPTAIALAFGPLPARAPDVVYGDLFGLFVIRYATGMGWWVLLGIAGAMVFAARRARKAGELNGRDVLRGLGASLYLVALAGAALEFGRRLTGVGSGWITYRPLLARFPVFEALMLALGLGALLATLGMALSGRSRLLGAGLAVVVGLGAFAVSGLDPVGLVFGSVGGLVAFASFGAPGRLPSLRLGLLLIPLTAAGALQVLAPTVAFVLAWPLAAAAVAACLADKRWRVPAGVLVVAIAAVALAWLGSLFHNLLIGIDVPAGAVLPVWLAAPVIAALAAPRARTGAVGWVPAGALLAVGLVLALFLRFTNPWSSRYPAPAEPVYVVDPAAGKAWVASLIAPDSWVRSILAAAGPGATTLSLPLAPKPVEAVAVSPVPVEAAKARLERLADGRIRFSVEQPPGAEQVVVSLRSSSPIEEVRINDQATRFVARDGTQEAFKLEPQALDRISWAAPSGFTMDFRTADPQGLHLETAEIYGRWMAAAPLPPMPAGEELWDIAGTTVVLGSVPALSP